MIAGLIFKGGNRSKSHWGIIHLHLCGAAAHFQHLQIFSQLTFRFQILCEQLDLTRILACLPPGCSSRLGWDGSSGQARGGGGHSVAPSPSSSWRDEVTRYRPPTADCLVLTFFFCSFSFLHHHLTALASSPLFPGSRPAEMAGRQDLTALRASGVLRHE